MIIARSDDAKGSRFVSDSLQRQYNLGSRASPAHDPVGIRSKLPATVPLGSLRGYSGYHSNRGGWAAATGAMNELVRLVAEAGCRFVQGTATRLCRVDGRVVGVELDDGTMLKADKTVLAAGSWSPRLLPEIRPSCVATGQSLAVIQLSREEAEEYATTPILMNLSNEFYLLPVRRFPSAGCSGVD